MRKHLAIPVVYDKGSVLLHEGQLEDHGLPSHPKMGGRVFIQAATAVAAGMGRRKGVAAASRGWNGITNDESGPGCKLL